MKHYRTENTTNFKGLEKRSAIPLIGNIQVGKSALFQKMIEGKSKPVSIARHSTSINAGKIKGMEVDILDTPGVYSIFSHNEDDTLSRDILLPNVTDYNIQGIAMVADGRNLKRSLAIFLQYADYGLPMLLDINMIDEVGSRGITIQMDKLSELLGIKICTTIAREGIGVRKLVSRLKDLKQPIHLIKYPDWIEKYLKTVAALLDPTDISYRAIGLLLLTGDRGIQKYIKDRYGLGMRERLNALTEHHRRENPQTCSVILTTLYNKKAEQIVSMVQQTAPPPPKAVFLMSLGDWCTQLSTGIPIAIGLLVLLYLFIGSFGATFLVDTINGTIFEGLLMPWTTKLVDPIPSRFIRDMIVDPDFGVLPTGVFLALGLVLPVLFCFYIAFGILEDSGYLPRLSVLLDKLFQKMGLNGKGVIPLIMGFSCVTMAILTTRMLDTKKEKNIATFILLLGTPCAPLLAVMLIILGKMPISAALTVFGLIFLQIFLTGFIANKILPGGQATLLMEIPAIRMPRLMPILRMSSKKTFFFMKEAVPVFILASVIVFVFERVGGLAALEEILKPVISGFMGLPEKSVQVFIKTIIRRESGATEIEHLSSIYDNVQIVVNLLVMTFLTPCMNAVIVLIKERGARLALAIMGTVMIYAIFIGTIVNHTCRFLGITFS